MSAGRRNGSAKDGAPRASPRQLTDRNVPALLGRVAVVDVAKVPHSAGPSAGEEELSCGSGRA